MILKWLVSRLPPKDLDFIETMRAETAKNSLIYARDLLNELGASDEEKRQLLRYFINALNGTVYGHNVVFDSKHVIITNQDRQFFIEDIKNHE
jgi:hypothetical protein